MKTMAEVNEKVESGKAVAVNAKENVKIVKDEGVLEVQRVTGERSAPPRGYTFCI